MTDQCPTCGAAVRIEASGTTHYMVPTDAERVRELTAQCERLRAERNAVRVKFEQPLLLRIRKLEDAIEQMALSSNTFEVMRLVDKAWQEILDGEEPPQ